MNKTIHYTNIGCLKKLCFVLQNELETQIPLFLNTVYVGDKWFPFYSFNNDLKAFYIL